MPTATKKTAQKNKPVKPVVKPVNTLAWPSQKAIESALILYIAGQGGEVVFKGEPREAMLNALADHFEISQRQRKLPHPTAGTKWSNKVQWAKLGLSKSGKIVAGNSRSTWTLDDELLVFVEFVVQTRSIAAIKKKKVKVA